MSDSRVKVVVLAYKIMNKNISRDMYIHYF